MGEVTGDGGTLRLYRSLYVPIEALSSSSLSCSILFCCSVCVVSPHMSFSTSSLPRSLFSPSCSLCSLFLFSPSRSLSLSLSPPNSHPSLSDLALPCCSPTIQLLLSLPSGAVVPAALLAGHAVSHRAHPGGPEHRGARRGLRLDPLQGDRRGPHAHRAPDPAGQVSQWGSMVSEGQQGQRGQQRSEGSAGVSRGRSSTRRSPGCSCPPCSRPCRTGQ